MNRRQGSQATPSFRSHEGGWHHLGLNRVRLSPAAPPGTVRVFVTVRCHLPHVAKAGNPFERSRIWLCQHHYPPCVGTNAVGLKFIPPGRAHTITCAQQPRRAPTSNGVRNFAPITRGLWL